MPGPQGRVKKIILALGNLLGLHICIRRKASEVSETDEKLLHIFNELTVGISEIFEEKAHQDFDEFLRCDKVSCKISVLSEQIGQVRILFSLWKNGYNLDPEELTAKLQSLSLLVDCIRDDVFHAYLQMPPDQKLQLLKKNKQVSAIFAVLGTLEDEVSNMLRTMSPNEELMKVVRPLLKPNFNRVVYKRSAVNVFKCDNATAYEAVEFSCKKVMLSKPRLVDACTDPVNDTDRDTVHDVGTSSREDINNSNYNLSDIIYTANACCQVSTDHEDVNEFNELLVEDTVLTDDDNHETPHDSLSINSGDNVPNEVWADRTTSWSSKSSEARQCPTRDVSFWRLAAELIVNNPITM